MDIILGVSVPKTKNKPHFFMPIMTKKSLIEIKVTIRIANRFILGLGINKEDFHGKKI